MGEEHENDSTWKSLKKALKSSYQDAKKKIKEYAQEGSEPESGASVAIGSKQYYGMIDENLTISCPICNSQIPKELLKNIGQSTSIVCERCGSQIDRAELR
ncbi:MAG: hypothetical protein ACTSVZ_10580 [Promethearchaeota archaeon]